MKQIKNEVKLRLVANNNAPRMLRGIITAILDEELCSAGTLSDIRISVAEAAMNCVIHAYKESDNNKFIYISTRMYDNNEFSIEISDNGCGFDTARIGEHKNEMGFVVMRNFMDSVNIKSKIGKGTTVLMRKRLTDDV